VAVEDRDLREEEDGGEAAPDGEGPRVGSVERVRSREVLRLEKASEAVSDFRRARGK
jgi:hypothetical protein